MNQTQYTTDSALKCNSNSRSDFALSLPIPSSSIAGNPTSSPDSSPSITDTPTSSPDSSPVYEQKFGELVRIMAKLRKGCPWDKKQTHKSLLPYVVEETYEVVEAVESESMEKVCEELGDLLLQIVFHAEIAGEQGEFLIEDVIDSINKKLIRRHPHIFGKVQVNSAEDVIRNWEEIKLNEKNGKKQRDSLMNGIPQHLPALLFARRIQERAGEVGFDWNNALDVLDKVEEEIKELRTEIIQLQSQKESKDRVEDELGDLIFALVNVGRWLNIDSESALRRTNRKFIKRFQYIESESRRINKPLSSMTLDEMESLWQKAKGS